MAITLSASSITGAANISASGTTYGLTIDSNGYVSKPLTPCYQGYIGSLINVKLSSEVKPPISSWFSQGITVNETTATFTVPVAGVYTFHAQQLVNVSGSLYLQLRKNGVAYAYGFVNNKQQDIRCTLTISCNANDTLSLVYAGNGTLTQSWVLKHSSIFLYQIG